MRVLKHIVVYVALLISFYGKSAQFVITDTNPNSLITAINNVNADNLLDTIIFNIPAAGIKTITATGSFPDISTPVFIDGQSQNIFNGEGVTLKRIVLNGNNAVSRGFRFITGAEGSTLHQIVIGNFTLAGVSIENTSNITVTGCHIGLDAAGSAGLGNSGNGITIAQSSGCTIGDTTLEGRNVISSNVSNGIELTGVSSFNNTIKGNYIGLDVNGSSSFGNSADGVLIGNQAHDNVVGPKNTISANGRDGVKLNLSGASNNFIIGNYIGTIVGGNLKAPNVFNGITIFNGADNNTIGGSNISDRNYISGNGQSGIEINASSNQIIKGNYIGISASGVTSLGNDDHGILALNGADNIEIGGTGSNEGNYIGGNGSVAGSAIGSGIYLSNGNDNCKILGNKIGVTIEITPGNRLGLPNKTNGIRIDGNSGNNNVNQIGDGSLEGENIIAFNGDDGIAIFGFTRNNSINRNSIYSNGVTDPNGSGIDLAGDGLTYIDGDSTDNDDGPNQLMNPPILKSISVSGQDVTYNFRHVGVNGNVRFDFYSSVSGDPFLYGEGEEWVGSVTLNVSNQTDYSQTFRVNANHLFFTMMATYNDNSSEFSRGYNGNPVATNSSPIAVNDTVMVNENSIDFSINALLNDLDPSTCVGSNISLLSSPLFGIASIDGGGNVLYSPSFDFYGTDSINYKICCTGPLVCDSATIYINVNEVVEICGNLLDDDNDGLVDGDDPECNSYCEASSVNLLKNPGFELGDTLFTTDNTSVTCSGAPPNIGGGNYSVTSDASDCHVKFSAVGVGGGGNYLVSNVVNSFRSEIWCERVPVEHDSTYVFRSSLNNLLTGEGAAEPNVFVEIESVAITPVMVVPESPDQWVSLEASWDNYLQYDTVAVCLINTSDQTNGNDLGVDQLYFGKCVPVVNRAPFILDTAGIPTGVGVDTIRLNTSFNSPIQLCVPVLDIEGMGVIATSEVATVTHGTTNIPTTDSCFTYFPNRIYAGNDSMMVALCDGVLCDTALVVISITGGTPPIAVRDSVSILEDSTLRDFNVVLNDIDTESNINPDTIFIINPTDSGNVIHLNTLVSYTPNQDFNGIDSLVYVACDSLGLCDTATLIINVEAVDDAPIAFNDTVTILEDATIQSFNVVLNDIDIEGNLDPTTRSLRDPLPLHGTAGLGVSGEITYIPDPDYNGSDTVIYKVCSTINKCDSAFLIINITPQPDTPSVVGQIMTIPQNRDSTFSLIGNASDIDDDLDSSSLNIISFTNGAVNFNIGLKGEVTFTYTDDPFFFGKDTAVYEFCDLTLGTNLCDTAMLIIDVISGTPPILQSEILVINEDTINAMINVAANDSDIDNGIDLGTLAILDSTDNGTLIIQSGGNVSYTPQKDYNGSDFAIYQLCDSTGLCSQDTVYFTVLPLPDKPVAVDDRDTTDQTSDIIVNIVANDFDVDNDLQSNSIQVLSSVSGVFIEQNVLVDGEIRINYSLLNPGFNGYDTITYYVCDQTFPVPLCDTAQVFLLVTTGNPPITQSDSVTTLEDTPVLIDVLANDSDVDGNILINTLKIIKDGSNGGATIVSQQVRYNPQSNFSGKDTVLYEICDFTNNCVTDTLFVTINPVDDPPQVVTIRDTVNQGACNNLVMFNITNFVSEIDSNQSLDLSSLRLKKSLSGVNANADVAGNVVISYATVSTFFGIDDIPYVICDDGGKCDSSSIQINVLQNTPPQISSLPQQIVMNSTKNVSLSAIVSDNQGAIDFSSLTFIDEIDSGTVVKLGGNLSIRFDYSASNGFVGEDTLIFELCDSGCFCSQDTMFITVVDTTPALQLDTFKLFNDLFSIKEGCNQGSVNVFDNDSTRGRIDTLTIALLPPYNADFRWSISTTGIVTASYLDTITVQNFNVEYTACDTLGNCDTASVLFDVVSNAGPNTVSDMASLKEGDDTNIEVAVLSNDVDIDGLNFNTFKITTQPNYGVAIRDNVLGTISVHFGDDLDYRLSDTIVYEICDSLCICSEDTLKIDFITNDSLIIYDGFSPNGDGINDVWELENIEILYPENKVQLFNRWGDLVFEVENYDNINSVWKGEVNQGIVIDNGMLPDGIYYYIIRLMDVNKIEEGSVLIQR